MPVLTGIEPERVFYYFEEITRIPHGSGNVEAISEYLVSVGASLGLETRQDEARNVIIFKTATEGYENEPAIIIQGHMDMVAVKRPGASIDMKTEGLKLAVDGDDILAVDTSLGGDDGIAVAMALAILEDDSLKHPRLEVVITTDEEVGMDGAMAICVDDLKGRRFLNLDSENEGVFTVGCAGGARVYAQMPLKEMSACRNASVVRISIGGLAGGHSGVEIDKKRENALKLAGRLMRQMANIKSLGLVEIKGGVADNAIASDAQILVSLDSEKLSELKAVYEKFVSEVTGELVVRDPGFKAEFEVLETLDEPVAFEMKNIAALMHAAPNGIINMSKDIEGLVETSLNMGVAQMTVVGEIPVLQLEWSVRSSVDSAKHALIDQLRAIIELAGGEAKVSGDYPGWKFRQDSPLRDKMVALYEEMYGKTPVVEAIHAGLECGLFAGKFGGDLDAVSIGPDMKDIHSFDERLSIASTKRVYEFVTRLIAIKD